MQDIGVFAVAHQRLDFLLHLVYFDGEDDSDFLVDLLFLFIGNVASHFLENLLS